MRRIVSLCLAASLALSLAVGARAAAAAELERAFVYGDTLYTYVDITGADQPITKADAEIDGRTFPASGTLETVRQAGFPVTWLLLVDNSNSMPPFREEVTAFARELAAACGENTRFSLASFGDQFTLLEEDAAAEQLSEAMAEIPMDETVTRLHSSIDAALDYFDGLPRSGSELRCLVVLSDAVQYDPNAAVSHGELLERINSSGVLVHSVGFGTDAEALESLAALTEASGGIHQVVGDSLTAADAAAALAEDAGALYVTGFSLAGFTPAEETAQVSVTFASGGELLCRGTAEVGFPTGEASEEVPEKPAEEPLPPPAEEPAPVGGTAPDSGEAAPASGGVPLPLPGQAATTLEDRLEKGAQAQVDIFGEGMRTAWQQGHINRWLADNCFGDYYTRTGLDLAQREMITFCFLAAQGGCEPQLTAHAGGNMNLGNDREFLIRVVSQCLPYIGYPRSLNAIRCIEDAARQRA